MENRFPETAKMEELLGGEAHAFMEWLRLNGYVLAHWEQTETGATGLVRSRETCLGLLAKWGDVNLGQLEHEKLVQRNLALREEAG